MAREMQTMIISKRVAPSRSEAERVFRKFARREPSTSRETTTSWRFRRFPPEECRGGWGTAILSTGVAAVYCDRRG